MCSRITGGTSFRRPALFLGPSAQRVAVPLEPGCMIGAKAVGMVFGVASFDLTDPPFALGGCHPIRIAPLPPPQPVGGAEAPTPHFLHAPLDMAGAHGRAFRRERAISALCSGPVTP